MKREEEEKRGTEGVYHEQPRNGDWMTRWRKERTFTTLETH